MVFKTCNTLLPQSWFKKSIIDTLILYDQKKDISNSPLIEFMRNWQTTGGMHLDCYKSENYEQAIHDRQIKTISLYEDIKRRGYIDDKPILVSFDEEGYIRIYDGHHRLSILDYLNIKTEVTVSTEWKGAVDSQEGKDFPLFETIERLHKGRRYLYQWVPDERLRNLPCSRKDAEERLEYLLARISGKTVLDIGCSEGYFTHELARRGYEVTGVDINKDLISIARYLGAIQGIKAEFIIGDWKDVIRDRRFDNIINFSVLHNEINAVGKEKAFRDLELIRGKTDRMFLEYPDVGKQPDWEFAFKYDLFHKAVENRTKLVVRDKWVGYRPILFMSVKPESPRLVVGEKVNIEGFELELAPSFDYLTWGIKNLGTWERRTNSFVKQHLNKGQTFVDVGAEVGFYTLLASKLGAKVISFEPSKKSLAILKRNVENNGCQDVKIIDVALSDTNGEAKLYKGNCYGTNSLVSKTNDYEIVKTARYDDLDLEIPDMIKIDVEFAERQVLEGMPNVLKTKKKLYLILEDWCNEVTPWLIKEHGFKLVTTDSIAGNKILAKNIKVKYEPEPLRIHLLGTFNTPTNLKDEGVANAFSSKVVRMAKILKRLGYYVMFYGVEGSEVECDEFIQVSTKEIIEKTYGKWEKDKVYGVGWNDLAHKTFNENAIREINKRKRGGDFLLCCYGTYQKQIADAVKIPDTVEIGIGYTGSFARYRIFESYYMMNYTYGAEREGNVKFYNTVIQGYFEPEDFKYSQKKDDYYLYLGRIVKRKGVLVAKQVCEKIGAKLIVAGFASRDNAHDIAAYEDVIKSPNVEYVGFAGLEKRKQLMSRAKAVFMPTTYLEPFGYVAIEAMMSGTPVITTDGGAFPETIVHGKTGYRCTTFEEFCWAAKNIDKIKPSDCRRWATRNYSMERAAKMYKEYFDKIISLRGKGWYTENPDRKSLDNLSVSYP